MDIHLAHSNIKKNATCLNIDHVVGEVLEDNEKLSGLIVWIQLGLHVESVPHSVEGVREVFGPKFLVGHRSLS